MSQSRERRQPGDAQRTYRIGASTLTVRYGDLLDTDAEVLVSSDDFMLSMGGGVSAAIMEAAGNALVIDAAKAIPCEFGDVVVTSAGVLDARYVFHVVTIGRDRMHSSDDGEGSLEDRQLNMIRSATERSLRLADALGVSSIAFPSIGSGVAGIDTSIVAAGMAESIQATVPSLSRPFRVDLCLRPKSWQTALDYLPFFEELAIRLSVAALPSPPVAAPAAVVSEPDVFEDRRERILQTGREVLQLERSMASGDVDAVVFAEKTQELAGALKERAPVQLFVSYSHADNVEAKAFINHLSGLRHSGLAMWSDHQIPPGAEWQDHINDALESADIALFLISAAFLSSEYCAGKEWTRALELQQKGKLVIIPVILRASLWQGLVGNIQALPVDGKPLASQPNFDEACLDVIVRIEEVVRRMRSSDAASR